MFTGIVEFVGRVRSVSRAGELASLAIEAGPVAQGVKLGDSVAVNGCCLTVTSFTPSELTFQAIAETLARTNLGDLVAGSAVNLERAMRADQRLDGHIVQGHVDETGVVEKLERVGDDVRFYVRCEPSFADLLVEKGSVAIDGTSLTVVGVREDGFDVALIPHTLEATTLGRRTAGERVNLEADILGKYVHKYLERIHGAAGASGR